MDLTLEHPGNHLFIRSVSEKGIQIAQEFHQGPLIVSSQTLVTDWAVQIPADLNESRLETILDLEPEIVLIGTGKTQVFLPPELMMFLYSRNTGFEVMTTDAAARTFNVLVSEGRNVVAALMPNGEPA